MSTKNSYLTGSELETPIERHFRFMADAKAIAFNHSKDHSTKLACLITDEEGSPLVWGYNGFPRGVNDNVPERHARPAKYFYTEHAERNAFYNAARSGISLKGSNLYLPTLTPCVDCARGIIQVGVKNVFLDQSAVYGTDERALVWREQFNEVFEMLTEGGVDIYVLIYTVPVAGVVTTNAIRKLELRNSGIP